MIRLLILVSWMLNFNTKGAFSGIWKRLWAMGHFQLFLMILKFSMGHFLTFCTHSNGPFFKWMWLWRMAPCLPNHCILIEVFSNINCHYLTSKQTLDKVKSMWLCYFCTLHKKSVHHTHIYLPEFNNKILTGKTVSRYLLNPIKK